MLASGVLSSGNVANAFLSESAGNCFSSALTTPAICAAADNRIKVRIKEYNNGENRHN